MHRHVVAVVALSALFVSTQLVAENTSTLNPSSEGSAVVTNAPYALDLDIAQQVGSGPVASIPPALKHLRLYRIIRIHDGTPMFHLRLGFFRTQTEAINAQQQLQTNFPKAKVIRVTPEEIKRSGDLTVSMDMSVGKTTSTIPPVPPINAAPTATAPDTTSRRTQGASARTETATNQEIEVQALALMNQARDALTRGDNRAAVGALETLLRLPPNSQSRDAQEFIGVAQERSGEIFKAKTEYEVYLRNYPEGEGADRVRQRLGAITAGGAQEPLKQVRPKNFSERLLTGSISQYYYFGNSKIETQTPTANTLDIQTLTHDDQKALITNVDIMGRFRDREQDNRIVFRDTLTNNFLPNTDDQNRLRAAYYEHRSKIRDWSMRLGRQPGTSGGVLGIFDGMQASYGIDPKWHLGLVAGIPVDLIDPIDSSRRFLGTSLEMGTFAEHWNSNVYLFQQTVDGITDRQAVGLELRYFDPRGSLFSLLDYDTSFGVLNTALMQASWQNESKTNYSILLDRRKTPALQVTNALMGEASTSVSALLQRMSELEIRRRALAVTATSTLASIGLLSPVSAKWQLGGDIKYSRISATVGTDVMPATPDTGDILTYTVQAIGVGLLSQRDISVFNVSYLSGDTYNGESVAATNRSLFGPWWLDSSVRWYQQSDVFGGKLRRISPTLRLGYRWKETVTLESEIGIENSKTRNGSTQEVLQSRFYSFGYRWDF